MESAADEKIRPHERPTSFDIAYRAGVSQSTVSRALRGDPNVNKETREKIQAIARELKYKVDKNASNLRRQRSNTIAVLFFEDPSPDASQINPFFLSMLGSITRACAKRSYDLLISFQCNQVVSRSFAWPHPATGMKPDTVKKLSEIVLKIFPQGT